MKSESILRVIIAVGVVVTLSTLTPAQNTTQHRATDLCRSARLADRTVSTRGLR